jgi:hypothetical protein
MVPRGAAPDHRLHLLPLFGGEDRVHRAPGALADGVQPRPYVLPDGLQLAALPVQERVDAGALIRTQAQLRGHVIPELTLAPRVGRSGGAVRRRTVVWVRTHVERQQDGAVQRHAGEAAGHHGKNQDQERGTSRFHSGPSALVPCK